METVFETRDILLALSFYMEHGGHTDERLKDLQKTFDDIANDKIVIVRKEQV